MCMSPPPCWLLSHQVSLAQELLGGQLTCPTSRRGFYFLHFIFHPLQKIRYQGCKISYQKLDGVNIVGFTEFTALIYVTRTQVRVIRVQLSDSAILRKFADFHYNKVWDSRFGVLLKSRDLSSIRWVQGSVWSSLPPLNGAASDATKPIILVVASMDSASFFRDKSLGAESPLSGLVALMAAADAFSHSDHFRSFKKQIVFLVVTGEAWGFLGSRRFLHELDQQSGAVAGLNATLIEETGRIAANSSIANAQTNKETVELGERRDIMHGRAKSHSVIGNGFNKVLEVGSVGKGMNGGHMTFYAHSAGVVTFERSPMSDLKGLKSTLKGSLAPNETFNALQRAQKSLKSDSIQILAASPLNPGIPPSSLMSFLKKNSKISGTVLEDFDSTFSNEFYHSHPDDISNIDSTSIVAAASLVARSLYILASDMKNPNSSDLDAVRVNASLVEELLDCLLKCDPGLSCGLVKSYISPTTTCPSNYVGVLVTDPSSPPYPRYSSDVSRFIWNFLADKTATQKKSNASNCQQDCNGQGELCIKAETDHSACVKSTTRYIPTYSTRLEYESGSWKLLPPNSSDPMSVVDPVWTESNWDVIGLRVYTMQDTTYDRLILLAGLGITGFSYFAIEVTKAIIAKSLKRD
ncbi:hypothetical protein Cgig2_004683 [Carnegiea gigantea]|uniref:Nicastrin n=1 Tax=Carnegiea gigantea TaxID=171969 RepID=A0A9Q1JSZ7_9CARY|nr:hypothetical protein Cgig2_004683 [Carnegiea gigantea]